MLKGKVLRAVGTMSGTSLDGVDAAVVVTDGRDIHGFERASYQPYTDPQRQVLRAALGKWAAEDVAEAAEIVETVHAQVLSGFDDVDLIGFHGQTVAHDPSARRTHQIGDGQVLAEVLQRPVVWDFRSADVHLGGQGAPLAPFFHHAAARWIGATAPICFLNLGGVGNITWVDPSVTEPQMAGALLAFDTGPANAPINDMMLARRGQPFDAEGALAFQGEPDQDVITDFLGHAYFRRMPPKSLDRDAFSGLLDATARLSDADAAATLTAAAAMSASEALSFLPAAPSEILVTGGGRNNAALMQMLAASVDMPVLPVEDRGLDGDMLEAQAFAYLAVRVVNGLPTSAPGTTGVRAAVCGGTLSRPGRVSRQSGLETK